MPSSTIDVQKELLGNLLARGEANYQETARISGVLDDKAQNTSTMAGALIAAGLVFVQLPQITLPLLARYVGLIGLILLALAIVSLVICLYLCLVTMWPRSRSGPLSFDALKEMVADLVDLSPDKLSDERQENHLKQQAAMWEHCLDSMFSVNKKKERALLGAQVALALALSSAAFVLLQILYRVWKLNVW